MKAKATRLIRIDPLVAAAIARIERFGETPNAVLRRVLNLDCKKPKSR